MYGMLYTKQMKINHSVFLSSKGKAGIGLRSAPFGRGLKTPEIGPGSVLEIGLPVSANVGPPSAIAALCELLP